MEKSLFLGGRKMFIDYDNITQVPYSAVMPNPKMIIPEIRFTHFSPVGVNLPRSTLTPTLNKAHQQQEPRKTPMTVMNAEE